MLREDITKLSNSEITKLNDMVNSNIVDYLSQMRPDPHISTTCNWNESPTNIYHHTGQFSTIMFTLPSNGKMYITFKLNETSYAGSVAFVGSTPDLRDICNRHLGDWNGNTVYNKISMRWNAGRDIYHIMIDLDNKIATDLDTGDTSNIITHADGVVTFGFSDGTSNGTGSAELVEARYEY